MSMSGRTLRSRTDSCEERPAKLYTGLEPKAALTRASAPGPKQPNPEMSELRKLLNEASLANEQLRATIAGLQQELVMLRQQMEANAAQATQEMKLAREEARMRETLAREDNERSRNELKEERASFQELLAQTLVYGGGQRLQQQDRQQQQQQQQQHVRRQKQQQQQQQQQRHQDAAPATVAPLHDQEGGSWAEVVRRKPVRPTMNQQQQWPQLSQRQQQLAPRGQGQQHQPRQAQGRGCQGQPGQSSFTQTQRTSQPNVQRGPQEGTKRRPRQRRQRNRPDAIEVTPGEGQTWTGMYQLVREAPELQEFESLLGVGRRTTRGRLVMNIPAEANATELLQRVQEVCEKAATPASSRLVTPQAEVRIAEVDPLAEATDVAAALTARVGEQVPAADVRIWESWNGTKTACARVSIKAAERVAGGTIKLRNERRNEARRQLTRERQAARPPPVHPDGRPYTEEEAAQREQQRQQARDRVRRHRARRRVERGEAVDCRDYLRALFGVDEFEGPD
uniref:Uncharacterized protein n=1 Tax=Anopheles minimus TaxID=112268 RepID=A0A182W7Z9_9DIPT